MYTKLQKTLKRKRGGEREREITWLAVACTGSVDLYFVLHDREIGPNFETIGGSNGISSSVLSEQTDILLVQ